MKISITTEILAKYQLSLREFGILLYYLDGGTGDIYPVITESLWNRHWLIKELMGYSFNSMKLSDIESISAESNIPISEDDRYIALADKLRELFPNGRKEGTNYMWRDSTMAIAKKLKTLSHKFNVTFTDEEAIEATKRYINSFNGDYRFMQLLKYFILKRDLNKQEETSQLLSFIQNEDISINNDNGELI